MLFLYSHQIFFFTNINVNKNFFKKTWWICQGRSGLVFQQRLGAPCLMSECLGSSSSSRSWFHHRANTDSRRQCAAVVGFPSFMWERPGLRFQLIALTKPCFCYCRHLGSEPANRKLSLSLSLTHKKKSNIFSKTRKTFLVKESHKSHSWMRQHLKTMHCISVS